MHEKSTLFLHAFILIVFFLLLIPIGVVFGGDPNPFFEEIRIDIGNKVETVLAADIDGDKVNEAVVVYRKGEYPTYELYLTAFKINRSEKGKPDAVPLFSIPILKDAVMIDSGRLGIEMKDRLFIAAHDGIYLLDNLNGKFEWSRIIGKDNILGRHEDGGIKLVDFIRDFNGDGLDEASVFSADALFLYSLDKGAGYRQKSFSRVTPKYFYKSSIGDLPFDMKYTVRGSWWIPQLISTDYNGDGIRDLVVLWEDEMSVLYGEAGGGFPEKPENIYFKDLTQEERDERNAYVAYFVEDLDGDGVADVIRNKFKGAFTSMVSNIEIDLRDRLKPGGKKTIRIKPKGSIGQGGLVWDIDGDGKKDLIITSASFGIFPIIKALLRKKIDLRFSFYLFKDGIGYAKDPDFSRVITFGFDLKDLEFEGILPVLDCDFNGDGTNDSFFATKKTELSVMINNKDSRFSLEDIKRTEAEVSKSFLAKDFDGDNRTDIAFWYPAGGSREKLVILLSRM